MDYGAEFRRLVNNQHLYAGIRLTLAVILPCLLLAHLGLLSEYFAFPLGVTFLGSIDMPGPFARRRSTLLIGLISFLLVALVINLSWQWPLLVIAELIIFGMFFSLIGIYGVRMAAVGSLSLIVFCVFTGGNLTHASFYQSPLILAAGSLWYLIVFLIVSTIQPYTLPRQMLGESYLELAGYLRIKARFYGDSPDHEQLFDSLISVQIRIKNQQESLREILFNTRKIVNESTRTGRLLMVLFLENVDLLEQLITTQLDYRKMQDTFGNTPFLEEMQQYILELADELENIGTKLQSNQRVTPLRDIKGDLKIIFDHYFNYRQEELTPENAANFIILEPVLINLLDIRKRLSKIYRLAQSTENFAGRLSAGLDVEKFAPAPQGFNLKVLKFNLSFQSEHFRHAVRLTLALLAGYLITTQPYFSFGHPYWVLITIIAILKPAYSITKSRNKLRIAGTLLGGLSSFILLYFVQDTNILFGLFVVAFALTYTFIRIRYLVAVFFMTMYVFLAFQLTGFGNAETLFRDRVIDTLTGGAIAFVVSLLILPVWEHTQNKPLILKTLEANRAYFNVICKLLQVKYSANTEEFKLLRKSALIAMANLSDNFQRMLSEPQNKKANIRFIHQFVSTNNLLTSYIASLSMYANKPELYPEINIAAWQQKTDQIFMNIINYIRREFDEFEPAPKFDLQNNPEFINLMEKYKKSALQEDAPADANKISRLSDLNSIQDLFELISAVLQDQGRIVQRLMQSGHFTDGKTD